MATPRVTGIGCRHINAVEEELPGSYGFKPGDATQQRRFSASRRPNKHHEFAFVYRETYATDRLYFVVRLPDVPEFDACHWGALFQHPNVPRRGTVFIRRSRHSRNARL